MNADRERILDEGRERLVRAVLRVQHLNDEFVAAVREVERIRRDVQLRTGVSLIAPPPLQNPATDAEFESLMTEAFPDGVTE